ncbi:MAG: hypothetical protein R2875_00430 [Desulfobacterales bacterium]
MLTFSNLWPFPVEKVKAAAIHAKKCVSVELNSMAQFRLLLRQQAGIDCAGAILKYDGRPLFPQDIIDQIDQFI